MMKQYYPALFLTHNLIVRNPQEMICLILCLKRLEIRVPKDILKLIYEELDYVELKKMEIHKFDPIHRPLAKMRISRDFDFAVIKVEKAGKIYFNDVTYNLSENSTCFLALTHRPYLFIDILCDKFSIHYHSFVCVGSKLYKAWHNFPGYFNSNIDGIPISYVEGTILRLAKNRRMLFQKNPAVDLSESIDLFCRHGLLTLTDPLKYEGGEIGYVGEQGWLCE